jgi:hypothetical protein
MPAISLIRILIRRSQADRCKAFAAALCLIEPHFALCITLANMIAHDKQADH